MSRTRMIKPSFFKHAELYAAEQESGLPLRIAFAGLWTVTDRAARFKWKHDLKPDVLPYDQVDMLTVLDALERYGFVRSYVVAGKKYGMIPSFADHQTFHHTERASTLPAPVVNGEPPVTSLADTVAVAGTVTELAADDLAAKEVGATVPPEPDLTALFLVICANKAVTEKWGESPAPFTQASAASLYDVLRSAGVPPDIARLSFYRQCREAKADKPPRSINYFRPGIEEDWTREQARRAVAASGEVPPSLEETSRPPAGAGAAAGARREPAREHWKDKNAREDREEAERQLVRMRHGNIEQRRATDDGEAWWRRMQREAKAAGVHPTLYGFDRLHEPAILTSEAAHA